ALSLANEREAADPLQPVLIAREPWLGPAAAPTVAAPAPGFGRAPTGPLHPLHLEQTDAAKAALSLARVAGLLPAVWVLGGEEGDVSIPVDDLQSEDLRPDVTLVSRARLPLDDMPDTQILAFRGSDDGQD